MREAGRRAAMRLPLFWMILQICLSKNCRNDILLNLFLSATGANIPSPYLPALLLKIPLYLTPMFGWETVYKVLEEFPDLTVVLSNIGWWPSARVIWPLLKRYPNFYFETGDFSQPHGLEEVCQKFGSHRVLYGSNFPTNAPAGSIYTLLKAKITDEERENIAHRNMERLLSEVKL